MSSRPVALVCAVVAAAFLVGSTAPASARSPEPGPHLFQPLTELFDAAAVYAGPGYSGCGPAAAQPVPDGSPITVTIPPVAPFTVGRIPATAWRHPASINPAWRLTFESLFWMKPLAQRAFNDGQTQSLAALVTQAVYFYRQNPDPGTRLYGWDEGTSLRRLETVNCLYALTHSPRLVAGMTADVGVQFGPRYYGPPYRAVHNHGLMANLRVIRAGKLLHIQNWQDRAEARIRYEAPLAFTRAGTSWEQSSAYQRLNRDLWNRAAIALASSDPADPTIGVINAATARATAVLQWLTEPDAHLVQIGDSGAKRGEVRPASARRALRDNQAGLIVGRWSWTDPTTTYYSVRYGPPRRAHGHDDKAAVTWSTAGMRILVGPGYFTEGTASHVAAYQHSMQAHNTVISGVGTFRTDRSTAVASGVIQAPAHAWTLTDALYGRAHTRAVNINHLARTFRVRDTFAGSGSFRQYWHLDPAWVVVSAPVNGTVMTFRHPTGRILKITTTGRLSSVVRGQYSPTAGWNFPDFGLRAANNELAIRSQGRTTTTTFVVS